MTPPYNGEDVEKLDPSHMAVGVSNGAATLEHVFALSYKTKHAATM